MSQPVKNGASSDVLSTSPGPSQVTFELSAQDMASIDADIASNQDLLNNHAQECCSFGLQMFTKARGLSDMAYVDLAVKDILQTVTDELSKQMKLIGVEDGQALKPAYDALITAKDGLVTKSEDLRTDSVSDMSDQLGRIDTYIKETKGKTEAEANTIGKGKKHEDNVHAIAKDWVKSFGGIADPCGSDNQPGDTVLEVPMPVGDSMRIVIEAKDEDDTARGTKWIDDRLLKSMQHRRCDTALWIAKKEGGLSPTQIGTWGPGKNTIGHWLATTIDNENTALTYLYAMELISRKKKLIAIGADIDLNRLQSFCLSIRGKLKKVQTINTKFGQISTLANEGKSEATDLRTEIRHDVTEIESIIKIAMIGGGAA